MEKVLDILDVVKWFLIGAFWIEWIFEDRTFRGWVIMAISIALVVVLIAEKIIKKKLDM